MKARSSGTKCEARLDLDSFPGSRLMRCVGEEESLVSAIAHEKVLYPDSG